MTPTVSVVIVNFNAGPLLARCLSSLEQQRWRDFEVIVVDNASRDDSLPAAARLPWVQISQQDDIWVLCGQISACRRGAGY